MPTTNTFRLDGQHSLEQMVRTALQSASFEISRRAHCELVNNQIRMTGQLTSYYQKQLAQEALRHLHPHWDIINEMEVVGN